MNDFDQAARYAVRMDPAGFFRWLIPDLPPEVEFRRWLDTRTVPFPREADRTCDTVAEFADPKEPGSVSAVVLEFQSEPDPNILDRLLEYIARLRLDLRHGPGRRQKYRVLGALLNLTGKVRSGVLDMRMRDVGDMGLQFRVQVRTMRDEDAAATLKKIADGVVALCILPWIPLMRGAGKRGIIEQWRSVAEREPNSIRRNTYAGLALTFAGLVGRQNFWRDGLKGWNMRESAIANEWREEGFVEAQQKTLLRVLQLRFQKKPSADVVSAVKAQSSVEKLALWLDAAVTAATPEEFRAALGQ